ncbi:MAG TPA: FkbM family methyltransferase [Pirellulales bacterium]|nr:FkbM family methyltransferase [Pirellulales bacterium]
MNKTKLCRYGEMIYRPNDVYIGRSLDLYGEFSEQEVQLFRAVVQPGQTVLDVGANIGAHSVALARLVTVTGKVMAFEPQRGLFYALCGNVAQNNLRQVRCYLAAVGETAGTIAVPELDGDMQANYGGIGLADGLGSVPTEPVPLMRIDDLQLSACHFIKVDVEGMEERVLRGAAETIRRFRPLLYVEDDRPDRSEDLRAFLFELGYELYVHRPELYNPANFAGHRENVFGRIVSLNLFGHPCDLPSPIRPEQFSLERLARPPANAVRRSKAAPAASFDEARRQHQAGNIERAVGLYRQLLLAEPNNAQAWYLLGAGCAQLGQLDEARSSLRQATGVNPRHAEAHNHLGVVLAQQASLDDAITSFRRALELKPDSLEVLNNLGLALLRQDKPDDAIAVFQRALELKPDDVKARHNLHRALRERGHFEELLTSQRQAIGQQPESAQAHNDLGLTLYEQGKLDEAAAAFRQAIEVKPDLAEAHNNLGLVRASQGHLDEAITAYRRAILLKPAFAEAHNNLGIALRQSGQAEAAVASCREAARLKPDLPEAHNNLGSALEEVGRYEEAITTLQTALRIKPDFSKAHNNLGIAYWYLGRYDEAAASYRRAIDLMPEMAEAHNNLGNVLRDQGKLEEAAECYRQAADLRPNYADPHWNQSLVWLLEGDFERGWAEYEWRWKLKNFKARPCTQPVWDGSSLEGKTILLAAEQGLGDTIQFIRYAPLVRQQAARVIAEVQRPLRQILGTAPGVDELRVQGEAISAFDTHVTLLSLPRLLETRIDTVPAAVPYLSASAELIDKWRDEIRSLPGFKVGIAWKGSPQNRTDRGRSLPLSLFETLARVPGVTLVSLQKGQGSEQIAEVKDRFRVIDLGDRLDAEAGPFMDTAAIMGHLDLIVTCDSSLAHLAGALGAPVWIALMLTPDWRWLSHRDDSPWYPSARLFRQTRVADWPEVFERMAAALREKIGS